MTRRLRAALALLGAAVLTVGVALPASAVTGWTYPDVPGSIATDLFPVNDYRLDSSYRTQPGYDLNARSTAMQQFCALTQEGGCNAADYASFFTVNSAAITDGILNVTITPTDPTSPKLVIWGPQSNGSYAQYFTATDHAYFFRAALVNGQPFGQTGTTSNYTCYYATPCHLIWDTSLRGADTILELVAQKSYVIDPSSPNLGLLAQYKFVIPVTPQNAPATPPTAAFTASLSGAAAHDWAFDASGSTAVSPATVASYRWIYGDGSVEVTTTPATHHAYADGSPHTAQLEVTDSRGTVSTAVSRTLTEPKLVVNSTGDAPATDPNKGCDTGGTVGSPAQPECTLRAAIQSLNAGVGGTRIGFALPAGSTTITTTAALPDITKAGATIDGTEPSGIPVISGHLHVLNAPGVTITKVAIVGGGDYGISFDGGAGATLTSSFVGVTPDGAVNAATTALSVFSGGAVTIGGADGAGDVIVGSANGLVLGTTSATSSARIVGNAIGETTDGTLLAASAAGVGILAAATSPDRPLAGLDLEANKVVGYSTNVAVVGEQVLAPRIAGNAIGVGADQATLLGTPQVNLRLDAAPGAVVDGNRIAGAGQDVLASGSMQTTFESTDQGTRAYFHTEGGGTLDGALDTPRVGTHVTFSNNRIGTTTDHPTGNLATGLEVWNLADDTTISGNTVLNHDDTDLLVTGPGARVSVTGNTVGSPVNVSDFSTKGVVIDGPPAPSITWNTIGGRWQGLVVRSSSPNATIADNTIGMWTDGAAPAAVRIGMSVEAAGAVVTGNVVGNALQQAIALNADGASVSGNRIGATRFGSGAAPTASGVSVGVGATHAVVGPGNTIVASTIGVDVKAEGTEVKSNTFGLLTSGALPDESSIVARASASIHDNTIAGSTVEGIHVDLGKVVAIQHNSIYGTAVPGGGIRTEHTGPSMGPEVRVVHGSSTRTFLTLANVPTDPGTIEVFGNASCADPEGKVPLFTTPTTSDSSRVISVADRADLLGFTVTVTTTSGTTAFSGCTDAAAAPDTDGDGIPDAVEALYPVTRLDAATSHAVAFVGDDQRWISMETSGTFTNVAPIDDPDPSGHPGATFPLGLIDWTVTGIEPGSYAKVAFTLPGTTINGWWKYSPRSTPQFFDYGYSPIAGYGAIVAAANLPIYGLSTNVALLVPDGGRGDDDGLENGAVRDPSAPAMVANAVAASTAPALTAPVASSLAATGTDPDGALPGGIVLLLAGVGLLTWRRRRRTR